MKDIILQKFFEHQRWEKSIKHCIDKDIDPCVLEKLVQSETQKELLYRVASGKYKIAPPRVKEIPKDEIDPKTGKAKIREVKMNFPEHRAFLNVANDLLFDLMPEAVHKNCKSYQHGIGCGKIVMGISKKVRDAKGYVFGFKADLSKYFDNVPIRYIDKAFDMVEAKYGKSAVIKVLRDYYHSDLYFDKDGNLCHGFQSLMQGCSVASWLADVVLYHIDEHLSNMKGTYLRYSDDILYIGEDYEEAMEYLRSALAEMDMELNSKKVEFLRKGVWFKFLGFMIKDDLRTIHEKRLATFVQEIKSRTIQSGKTYEQAIHSVNRYLYIGDGKHSWASQILSVVNVDKDIDLMNGWVMDCLRAVETGKTDVNEVVFKGYASEDHCLQRNKGRNVKKNKEKIPFINGYKSLGCMKNALSFSYDLYQTMILEMK